VNADSKRTAIEWGLLVSLACVCILLTGLQYHWIGELANAEEMKLHNDLRQEVHSMCLAFDTELAEACAKLLPLAAELDERGRQAAHIDRFRKWSAAKPRPIFRRIAVVVPLDDKLQLYEIPPRGEGLVPMEWPNEWAALQGNLSRKRTGGSPPYSDPMGVLADYPVFRGSGAFRKGAEREWLVLELDVAYAREVWLPELARTYLNSDGATLIDVDVSTVRPPVTLLYSSRTNEDRPRAPEISARFNQGHTAANSPIPVPPDSGRWMLKASHRPGALEAIVSASRRRNLATAIGLNLLLLATGIALVRYTRRSRLLAETRMNFVANVSHELRTPLTVIRGAAHNLQRGVVHDPKRIEQYSRLIIQHAEQLTHMIEEVLELASATKGHLDALRQPVALSEMLTEAVAATASETQSARCEVQLQLPPALPAIRGDAAALRRVFQNLISNAARHGGSGGWIGISATPDENSDPPVVEIQVADRGPGIPTEELSEIFKPFFRGALARARQTRGSGLGLSLSREIVDAHGGKIAVRSRDGKGTTFLVRLPAGKSSAQM
jgi:signal transduction histidine kinase